MSPQAPDNQHVILVVDDEPRNRRLLRALLEPQGYCVEEAGNGAECLERAAAHPPDLILLDVMMPGMNGVEVCRRLKQHGGTKEIPVIIVTAQGDRQLRGAAKDAGGDDFLDKPVDAAELLARTRNLLKTKTYHDAVRQERDKFESLVDQRTAKLREAHREIEDMLASMSSFLIQVDTNLYVRRWNIEAEKIFGVPAKDVLQKPFVDTAIQWDWDSIIPSLPQWAAFTRPARIPEVAFTRPDGTGGVLGITVNPLKDDADISRGFFLLGTDISERKTLEAQLVQAQKLESIGQLATGIAHEINTPTQYVGDNVGFLKETFEDLKDVFDKYDTLLEAFKETGARPDLAADIEHAIEEIDLGYLMKEIPDAIDHALDGVERIGGIVRAMKDFAHPGNEEKTPIDINKAVESTVTIAKNEWKYVAELATDLDNELPPVSCFPGEFNQVLLNLIVNAAHAIGDAADRTNGEKGLITIKTSHDGAWAEVRISDTGTGIPEHAQNRIFDPFFTTKEVGKGTGQGLAIAHNVIVEKHGGTLTFDTQPNEGTTFLIRLPLRADTKLE